MRNTGYIIRIITKNGRIWKYLKESDHWEQIGPSGLVHRLTSEQFLSHFLPPLAGDQPGLSVMIGHRRAKSPGRKDRKPRKKGA